MNKRVSAPSTDHNQSVTDQKSVVSPTSGNGIAIQIFPDSDLASRAAADEIAALIRSRASEQRCCVLGLATGSTPVRVYQELVRQHQDEGLSLENVITFNLDEYLPMAPDAQQSYVRFMQQNLFNHVDIPAQNIHIPDGTIATEDVPNYCRDYEDRIIRAGGIDLQLLGIGRTGHIGFNEPGSTADSITRMVTLDPVTRADAANDFGGIEKVPSHAITMGVRTILQSRRIRLLAFGDHKASIVQRTIEGEVSTDIPATYLQSHSDVQFLLDPDAAALTSPTAFANEL
ncbi:Glucosamine-6-phosphate deaminase 1 [Rubripirellula lacrimiformis]|uniref:Glucosamine-6-phosphate deaminase n=1 Tax=Rubripirellula lacrimiformis TaxID=1930273 RepID=A0A517NEU6_9BACT|nr:glucosamine-6-phosphate deaminase [Rubripirellula lacrimiformis]QDT05646.1 Glucosamine-6-phosphate deaminase 1 [Rubripirellula lacrimiformis]